MKKNGFSIPRINDVIKKLENNDSKTKNNKFFVSKIECISSDSEDMLDQIQNRKKMIETFDNYN